MRGEYINLDAHCDKHPSGPNGGCLDCIAAVHKQPHKAPFPMTPPSDKTERLTAEDLQALKCEATLSNEGINAGQATVTVTATTLNALCDMALASLSPPPGLELFLGLSRDELEQEHIAFLQDKDSRNLKALREHHTAGLVRALCTMILTQSAPELRDRAIDHWRDRALTIVTDVDLNNELERGRRAIMLLKVLLDRQWNLTQDDKEG